MMPHVLALLFWYGLFVAGMFKWPEWTWAWVGGFFLAGAAIVADYARHENAA